MLNLSQLFGPQPLGCDNWWKGGKPGWWKEGQPGPDQSPFPGPYQSPFPGPLNSTEVGTSDVGVSLSDVNVEHVLSPAMCCPIHGCVPINADGSFNADFGDFNDVFRDITPAILAAIVPPLPSLPPVF